MLSSQISTNFREAVSPTASASLFPSNPACVLPPLVDAGDIRDTSLSDSPPRFKIGSSLSAFTVVKPRRKDVEEMPAGDQARTPGPEQEVMPHRKQGVKYLSTDGKLRYRCTVKGCTKTFSRNEHYKRHLVTHGGEREFVCEKCGKAFNRSDNLLTHSYLHSPKNGRAQKTPESPPDQQSTSDLSDNTGEFD